MTDETRRMLCCVYLADHCFRSSARPDPKDVEDLLDGLGVSQVLLERFVEASTDGRELQWTETEQERQEVLAHIFGWIVNIGDLLRSNITVEKRLQEAANLLPKLELLCERLRGDER